jgi:hypothetical protein
MISLLAYFVVMMDEYGLCSFHEMDEVCMWTDDIPSMLRCGVYLPVLLLTSKKYFSHQQKKKTHQYFSVPLFSKLKFLGVLQRKVA